MKAVVSDFQSRSLAEINASVGTSHRSLWRRLLAFAGPAYLVSVGYMDPGNWITDLEGGSRFGYELLWVLLMSNGMAIVLQALSARLGVVTGRDLAQACREAYPSSIRYVLWLLCEIAIGACDLAEVLGAAIALHLLFGIPLIAGVVVTAADTLILLWMQQFSVRSLELLIVRLIVIIAACLGMELYLAKPDVSHLVTGLVPRLNRNSLFATIAILGATVMPHNLYLHSALVQSRRIGRGVEAKRNACRYNLVDTMVALNAAVVVNISILVVAAAVFFRRGIQVTEIQQAAMLLEPLLGNKAASIIFAVALLCVGQASTLTGTMAGQIVMEGFLNFRMRAWLRRCITRSVAIVPAALTIQIAGDKGVYDLLLVTQAILSLQLPFAAIPLIRLTSDRRRMGELVSGIWLRGLAWLVAGINLVLLAWLAHLKISEWLTLDLLPSPVIRVLALALLAGLALLLAYISVCPMRIPAKNRFAEDADRVIFIDSADRAHEVFENLDGMITRLPGVTFLKDPAGRYVYVSGAAMALWGVAPEALVSKTDDEMWPADSPAARDNDAIVYAARGRFHGIETISRADGRRSFLTCKFPVVDRSTQAVYLGGVAIALPGHDCSEEQLRGLATRLQTMREREREVASREVHDIGQVLSALNLQLAMIAATISRAGDLSEAAESLQSASDLLASAILSSAKISEQLRPSLLDNLGLPHTISWHARKFSAQTGIHVIEERLDEVSLPTEGRVLMYRMFQGLLENIERHAGATEIRISLSRNHNKLVLQVTDNGRRTADTPIADPDFLGLVEVRELTRSIGGTMTVQSSETEGTAVTIEFGLPWSSRALVERPGA